MLFRSTDTEVDDTRTLRGEFVLAGAQLGEGVRLEAVDRAVEGDLAGGTRHGRHVGDDTRAVKAPCAARARAFPIPSWGMEARGLGRSLLTPLSRLEAPRLRGAGLGWREGGTQAIQHVGRSERSLKRDGKMRPQGKLNISHVPFIKA